MATSTNKKEARKPLKCPSKACYCGVLTVWLAVAVLVFIVSSILYVEPLFRSLRFRFTTCRVENTFVTTQFICRCDAAAKSGTNAARGATVSDDDAASDVDNNGARAAPLLWSRGGEECKSSYPCLLVHVSLNVSDGETWTVCLYKNEEQQYAVINQDRDKMEWCSLKVCDSDALNNHAAVEDFEHTYGRRGQVLRCAYDPWHVRNGAVIAVTPLSWDVFHALFWPFLAIVVGLLLCVIFCRRCRQQDREKEERLAAQGSCAAAVALNKLEEGGAAGAGDSSSSDHNEKSSGAKPKAKWAQFRRYKSARTPDASGGSQGGAKGKRERRFLKSKTFFT